MTLDAEAVTAVENLERELNRTVSCPEEITLRREDASTLRQLIEDLIAENNERTT